MSDDRVGGDSELRRRAAWLFGMLVLVAVLIVVVMSTLLGGNNSGSGNNRGALGPDAITSTGPAANLPSAPGRTLAGGSTSGNTSTATTASSAPTSPSAGSTATTATNGPTDCPTSKPCALDTDIDNAIAYINAYRVSKGLPAVPGSVSDAAKACALSRGNGCKGGWAETEVPAPASGQLAVKKISQFAKFTDAQMKAIEVGWAYNPGTHTYYFATIRQD